MKPIPLNPETEKVARRVIWFEPPAKALADPDMAAKLAKLGVEPEQMSVDQFGKFVKDDIAATVQLAKAADIKPVD